MENKNILHDKEIAKLADVLENKTYMTFENPELKEVVFDYGDFGDLTVKDSGKNGNGMIHVIQRRSEIDGLNSETIANLLLKIAEIAKTEKITGYDETGTRAFINKDGIRVILQKNFQTENNKKGTWLISGYGIFSKEHELNLEATETIETVNAQYGYKPDHSRLRNQVGAVIASINNIRQKQLAVKKEKESIKVENGTKQITTQNAMTVYARAVLKESPSFVSDKELITAFAAANYAKNALTNGSQSQMLKKTKNRKLIEIAASQTHIDAYENELISRGYTLNVQNTFSETNVNYSRTVRVNVSEGKERIIETLRNESQEQENLRTEPSSSPTDDIQQVSPSVNKVTNTLTEEQHEEFLNDFRNVLSPQVDDFFDYIKKINYKPTLEDYKAFLYAGCADSFAGDGIHFAFEIMPSDIQEEIKKDTDFVEECVEAAKANLNNDNWDGWFSPNKEDWQMSGFIKIMTFAGEEINAQKFLHKTHIDAINTYIPRKAYEEYVKDWKKEHDYKEGVSEPASFDEFMTNEYREHEIVKGLLSEENYKNYLQLEIETFREGIENRAEISLEKAELLSSYLREENSKDKRPTAEQIIDGVENGWDFEDVCRGYIESTNDFLPNVLTIQRIDDMMVFESDEDAAIQAEKDGIKLIAKNKLHFSKDDDARHYRYIDTVENRKLLQEAGILKEQKNISEETELYKKAGLTDFNSSTVINNNMKSTKEINNVKQINGYQVHEFFSNMQNNEEFQNELNNLEQKYSADINSSDNFKTEDGYQVNEFFNINNDNYDSFIKDFENFEKKFNGNTISKENFVSQSMKDLMNEKNINNQREYNIQRLENSLKPKADFEYTNEYERLNKYEVGTIDSELIKEIYPEKSKSWNLSEDDYADIYVDLYGDVYIQMCSGNKSSEAGNFEIIPFDFAQAIRNKSLDKARNFLKERFEHNFIPNAEWSSDQFGGEGGDYYIGTIDGNTVKAFEPRVENLEDKNGNPVNFYGKVFSDTEGSILVELWDKVTGDIIHPKELLPDEYVFPKVSKEFKEKAIDSINRYCFTQKLDWTHFAESQFNELKDRLKEMEENPQQLFYNERAGILQIGDLQIDVNANKERHAPRYIDFEVFYPNPNGDREFNGDINDTGRKALGEDALPLKYSKDEDNVMSAVFVDDEKTPKIEEMDFYDFKNFIGNHIYQQMKDNPLIENALEKENVSWVEAHKKLNENITKENNKELITIKPYDTTPENVAVTKKLLANLIKKEPDVISNELANAFIDNLGVAEDGDKLEVSNDGKQFKYYFYHEEGSDKKIETSTPDVLLGQISIWTGNHTIGAEKGAIQLKDNELIEKYHNEFLSRFMIKERLDFSEITEKSFETLKYVVENYDNSEYRDVDEEYFGRIKIGDIHIEVNTRTDNHLEFNIYHPEKESSYGWYHPLDSNAINDRPDDKNGVGLPYEYTEGAYPHLKELKESIKTMDFEQFKDYLSEKVIESLESAGMTERALQTPDTSWDELYENYNKEFVNIVAYEDTLENVETVRHMLSNILKKPVEEISKDAAEAVIDNIGYDSYDKDEVKSKSTDTKHNDHLFVKRNGTDFAYIRFMAPKKGEYKLESCYTNDPVEFMNEVYDLASVRAGNGEKQAKNFDAIKPLKEEFDELVKKNPISLSYAFTEKDKDNESVTIYEEPRWHWNNREEAWNIIKQISPEVYDEMTEYAKQFNSPKLIYIDIGKSLRYDEEYAKETLENKLDNLFIVRYSGPYDDGNFIDEGSEVIIKDEKLVKQLNSLIENHVRENIENYREYSKSLPSKSEVTVNVEQPKIEFKFTDKEDITVDTTSDTIQMRVFNNDEKFELEKMLDPEFDIEYDAISFYYNKNVKTGAENIYWCNHTAIPNREGYIATSKLSPEIKSKVFETIRPIFEREYDSYSFDRIFSEGLNENLLKDKKETFLKDTLCSENAYNKAIKELKNQSSLDLDRDFKTAIGYNNNEVVKELLDGICSHNMNNSKTMSTRLFTALENWNYPAFKMILDIEKVKGEIIRERPQLLGEAAADFNLEIIDDLLTRYENNKELLSELTFYKNQDNKTPLQIALDRWHDIEADFSDKEIPDAITMIATAEDSVTNGSKISVFIDPKTGTYMTVNTLINGYETNIFDKNMNLIAHDTMDGYTNWEGNQKNAESQLEAALVTMQAEQGKNWSNWKKFEIIAGPERIKLGEELLRITKKTFDEMQKKSFENLDAFNKSKTAGEHNNQIDSSSTAKSVTERYLNSVKKILHDEVMENKGWFSDTQPVEKVLIAAQKALSAFSDHEKKEISRFLLSKGARDKDSMENIIKRSISTEKSHKREKTDRPIPER